jgi:trans-2,3-dihydro-3-hydroxyanthranilate isomerase
VVHDADGLDDETMLRFARETRLSETTFVQTASAAGADYLNRILTVGGEIPFAGHPSLGTAVAVARRRDERRASYTQQTGSGLQPIEVERHGQRARASMLQPPAEFGGELDPAALVPAVGLSLAAADPVLAPQIVSTGLPTALVPVAQGALERLVPDLEALGALEGVPAGASFYCFHHAGGGSVSARMFTGMVEGGEDPATGSAAGPLCVYLSRYAGVDKVEITQGAEMGRPSRLHAAMEDGGVRVAGEVVTVVEGTLFL